MTMCSQHVLNMMPPWLPNTLLLNNALDSIFDNKFNSYVLDFNESLPCCFFSSYFVFYRVFIQFFHIFFSLCEHLSENGVFQVSNL